MKLSDQIEIVSARYWEDGFGNPNYDWTTPTVVAVLPAHVTYMSTALDADGGSFMLSEELRVICPVIDFNAETQRIRWRGTLYTNNGQPLVRMRGNVPHHMTVPIKRVTG